MEDENEFQVPLDALGLHVLHEPKNSEPKVDIVAVHGLGGNAFSTWTDRNSNCLWLRDLLPKSGSFADARIMTFGYDARAFIQPFAKATRGRTFTFAEALLNDLADNRIGVAAHRPIIFVGHSLGGIVIKAALRHANERRASYGEILDSTHSIVFFGTPHQGADAAVWAAYLDKISRVLGVQSTKVLKELERWSDPLVDLTVAFSEHVDKFQITTFFETLPLHGVIVVPEGSARIGWQGERYRGLEGDHRSICKFAQADPRFEPVKKRFEAVMEDLKQQMKVKEMPPVSAPVSEPRDQILQDRLRALD